MSNSPNSLKIGSTQSGYSLLISTEYFDQYKNEAFDIIESYGFLYPGIVLALTSQRNVLENISSQAEANAYSIDTLTCAISNDDCKRFVNWDPISGPPENCQKGQSVMEALATLSKLSISELSFSKNEVEGPVLLYFY